jgi:alkanesulfonate monooxygenase SsuD/methylene tetrahydromethanopterin reductase-like flavin-dependent oxidoreductase (luciferase family)
VNPPEPGGAPLLGRFGIWVNSSHDDETRTRFVIEAEALGYSAAWLGFGRRTASDLALAERILRATSAITVATAIINMWTNDPRQVAASYRRIAARTQKPNNGSARARAGRIRDEARGPST